MIRDKSVLNAASRALRRSATLIGAGIFLSWACMGAAIVSGFNTTSDGRNDDGTYTLGGCNNDTDGGTCDGTLVPIGFAANFFGINRTSLFINTNGNVTFDFPLSSFTPFGFDILPVALIAPFFADVDTRNPASGVVTFGNGFFDSRLAFGVNWIDVGYYERQAANTNRFQLLLVDRSNTGAGNFDIIFNFDRVLFESGDASNGSGGLGGDSARSGFSDGSGNPGTFFELPGSGVPGSFIDGGTNALVSHSLNSNVLGQYIFTSRDGTVTTTNIPEPASILLVSAGAVMAYYRRRVMRQKSTYSHTTCL